MLLIPLDFKNGPTFHKWSSHDMLKVCPDGGKLPLLQTHYGSSTRFQISYFAYYPSAESNPSYPSRFFQSITAIEYP